MVLNNPQANAPVDRVHQVIYNILVTKYLDNKVFYYAYPWVETLSSIACTIREFYRRTVEDTPGQAVFSRDMIFNLVSFIDWQVITSKKQRQVIIDNVRENYSQVSHDYAVGYLVYVNITGIYRKLYYKKFRPYRIIEVFTNGAVWVQKLRLNKRINIRFFKI